MRPLRDVLRDYKRVLQIIYEPAAYAARLQRLASLLDRPKSRRDVPAGDTRGKVDAMQMMQRIVTRLPEAREPFLRVLKTCVRENPDAMRIIVRLMAMYLHLGPFSRRVIAAIDRRIEGDVVAPPGQSLWLILVPPLDVNSKQQLQYIRTSGPLTDLCRLARTRKQPTRRLGRNVRYWHRANIRLTSANIRFTCV